MSRPPQRTSTLPPMFMVAPPYHVVEAPAPAPALGSLFLLDVDEVTDPWAVAEATRAAPWVPLVLVQRSSHVPGGLMAALEHLPGTPAFVWRRAEDGLPLVVLAQDAVRSRPAPDADQAAHWVAARCGRAELAQSLVLAMGSRPRRGLLARLSPAGRWTSRRLRTLSPLMPDDWRDAFHLATAAGNTRVTTAQAAQRLGVDIWTLRRRLDRLAGVTADQYRQLAGWEWLLEAVVRKWVVSREA